jgi:membrane-associated protein
MALSNVLDWLQSLPEPALLAGTGALALGEAIIGLGFLIPGEAGLLIASATVDSVPEFFALWAVVTVGALIGNVIGFEIGRRGGSALRETKLIRKHGADGWDRAAGLLRKHGGWAVFVGRLIPFVRSFVPAVAGAAHMSYRAFLPPVMAGAACATALPILFGIGVAAGVKSASGVVLLVVAGLLLTLVVFLVIRKRRKKAESPALEPAG